MPKEPAKPTGRPSDEALYRFRVVCDVLAREMRGQKRAESVPAVVRELPVVLSGTPKSAGPRTIYRWLAAFDRN